MSNKFTYDAILRTAKSKEKMTVEFSNPVSVHDVIRVNDIDYMVFMVVHCDDGVTTLDCDKMTPDLT